MAAVQVAAEAKRMEIQLQDLSKQFQKFQTDLTLAVEARQRLDSQLTENEGVLKEFSTLKPHNEIYKLLGPALIKQDSAEAKTNVEKRLEFIKKEIARVEDNLKDLSTKSEAKKLEIVALQGRYQQLVPQ